MTEQEATDFRNACIASQVEAGFKKPDLREIHCPGCKASGYNSGWGYWTLACGAEIMSDGEQSEDCGKQEPKE